MQELCAKMRGSAPTLKDIVLQSADLVEPVNLYCDEDLSQDSVPDEEEELVPYSIDTTCECEVKVRLVVKATRAAIRTLEQLLYQELQIVCPVCSRRIIRNGRH